MTEIVDAIDAASEAPTMTEIGFALSATYVLADIFQDIDPHNRLYVQPDKRTRAAAEAIFKYPVAYTKAYAAGLTPEQHAYAVWHTIQQRLDNGR